MTEQRYRAVLEADAGVPVSEIAERYGVSRQAVHRWINRYRDEGLDGLADRSHRPLAHPAQTSPDVEAAICELRRAHPRWGQRRLEFELGRSGCPGPVPSLSTIYRVLVRHGFIAPVPRRRRRQDYQRWEREVPMELWQLDIVGGIRLADGGEAKVITGVDDHSRFCVIATVVRRATGRAVCLAFAEASRRFGIPDQVLTDNGKQFTGRFAKPRPAEVLFEQICRRNGIDALHTKPHSPTTTGKVERFHQTLERELLDEVEVWEDVAAVQAAVDRFRVEYNTDRPHQSLNMAFPVDRFVPRSPDALALRLPSSVATALPTATAPVEPVPAGPATCPDALPAPVRVSVHGEPLDLAVEVDRVVPASGNLAIGGQQFWLGPARAATTVTFWLDATVVHLIVDGIRLKTVPSRLSVAQLGRLLEDGGRPAGPPPIRTGVAEWSAPVEVDRTVNGTGSVGLAGRQHPVGVQFAGRRVTVRLDHGVLQLVADGMLLRSLPNPLSPAELGRLRDARPAGPAPAVSPDPPIVERRVSSRGAIAVARQRIQVGMAYAGRTVAVESTDITWRVHDGDVLIAEAARTTTRPIARFKVRKPEPPRTAMVQARPRGGA